MEARNSQSQVISYHQDAEQFKKIQAQYLDSLDTARIEDALLLIEQRDLTSAEKIILLNTTDKNSLSIANHLIGSRLFTNFIGILKKLHQAGFATEVTAIYQYRCTKDSVLELISQQDKLFIETILSGTIDEKLYQSSYFQQVQPQRELGDHIISSVLYDGTPLLYESWRPRANTLKLLIDALDKTTPLGKFFWTPRGWRARSTKEGTLQNIDISVNTIISASLGEYKFRDFISTDKYPDLLLIAWAEGKLNDTQLNQLTEGDKENIKIELSKLPLLKQIQYAFKIQLGIKEAFDALESSVKGIIAKPANLPIELEEFELLIYANTNPNKVDSDLVRTILSCIDKNITHPGIAKLIRVASPEGINLAHKVAALTEFPEFDAAFRKILITYRRSMRKDILTIGNQESTLYFSLRTLPATLQPTLSPTEEERQKLIKLYPIRLRTNTTIAYERALKILNNTNLTSDDKLDLINKPSPSGALLGFELAKNHPTLMPAYLSIVKNFTPDIQDQILSKHFHLDASLLDTFINQKPILPSQIQLTPIAPAYKKLFADNPSLQLFNEIVGKYGVISSSIYKELAKKNHGKDPKKILLNEIKAIPSSIEKARSLALVLNPEAKLGKLFYVPRGDSFPAYSTATLKDACHELKGLKDQVIYMTAAEMLTADDIEILLYAWRYGVLCSKDAHVLIGKLGILNGSHKDEKDTVVAGLIFFASLLGDAENTNDEIPYTQTQCNEAIRQTLKSFIPILQSNLPHHSQHEDICFIVDLIIMLGKHKDIFDLPPLLHHLFLAISNISLSSRSEFFTRANRRGQRLAHVIGLHHPEFSGELLAATQIAEAYSYQFTHPEIMQAADKKGETYWSILGDKKSVVDIFHSLLNDTMTDKQCAQFGCDPILRRLLFEFLRLFLLKNEFLTLAMDLNVASTKFYLFFAANIKDEFFTRLTAIKILPTKPKKLSLINFRNINVHSFADNLQSGQFNFDDARTFAVDQVYLTSNRTMSIHLFLEYIECNHGYTNEKKTLLLRLLRHFTSNEHQLADDKYRIAERIDGKLTELEKHTFSASPFGLYGQVTTLQQDSKSGLMPDLPSIEFDL